MQPIQGNSTNHNGSQSNGGENPTHAEENKIQVYLRFRPMNKLEASRRSKHCVKIHDDKGFSVASPHHGCFEFTLDRVFREDSSQADVYKHSLSPVATQLLEGYNCTVITYGQTGTGKTHTMMGTGVGAAGMEVKMQNEARFDNISDKNGQGMIPRTVDAIFSLIEKSPPTIECTIHCSYVELYLEKLLDLTSPTNSRKPLSIQTETSSGSIDDVKIVGASKVQCCDKSDVLAILARGNAYRTASHTQMDTDSSRSHAIFTLYIKQKNNTTGEIKKSALLMIDAAGSEMLIDKGSVQGSPIPVGALPTSKAEGKMLNKALSNLKHVALAQAKREIVPRSQSKLTRLLRPSLGGNCKTILMLVASPSSYNAGETISTIEFGQIWSGIMNSPVINVEYTPQVYQMKLAQLDMKYLKQRSEKKQTEADLKTLVKALAEAYQNLKKESTNLDEESHNEYLWDAIKEILKDDGTTGSDFSVIKIHREIDTGPIDKIDAERFDTEASSTARDLAKANELIQKLEGDLEFATRHRNAAENSASELQSTVAVLGTQNHVLKGKINHFRGKLIASRSIIEKKEQEMLEIGYKLRTSELKTNEATVFLRQFRRFYQRLLEHQAAFGSGTTQEIIHQIPGVPKMCNLIDVDTIFLQFDLPKKEELGKGIPTGVCSEASSEEVCEVDLLMQELYEMTEQCINLQLIVKEYEEMDSMVEGSRQAEKGSVFRSNNDSITKHRAAIVESKASEELLVLRQELDRKGHDFKAVIYKMNELHLTNKMYNAQLVQREEHIDYLEGNLIELLSTTRRLRSERKKEIAKHGKEQETLKAIIADMTVPQWYCDNQDTPRQSSTQKVSARSSYARQC